MYTNIRSLLNNCKREEIYNLLHEKSIDILGITESWAHDGVEDGEIEFAGYTMFRKDRNEGRGGGVILYVNTEFSARRIEVKCVKDESIWVELNVGNKKIRFGVCYRSPTISKEEEEELYSNIHMHTTGNLTVIMGDFNLKGIDWELLLVEGGSKEQELVDLVNDCFLTQHVCEETRGKNILDLVFSTDKDLVSNVQLESPVANSDHNVITFQVNCEVISRSNATDVYDYNKGNYKLISEELDKMNWLTAMEGLCVEGMWKCLVDKLHELKVKFIPRRTVKKKVKTKPWMKNNLRNKIKKKNSKWRNQRLCPTYENIMEYRKARNEVTREIRRAKCEFEVKLAEKISKDSKVFYQYVNSRRVVKSRLGPLENSDGKLVDDDVGMADVLNKYFASVFTHEDTVNMPEVEEMISEEDCLKEVDITCEMVGGVLRTVKENKSAGPDGIHSTYIVKVSESVINPLTIIFRKSFETGEVPMDWKKANITALHKKGSKKDPSNYRPVSLTSQVCKCFERIIKEAIMNYVEERGLLYSSQHGFRKKRSCLTNLLEFLEKAGKLLDEGNPVDVIYLDLKKAFDTVPHKRLILKMKGMGIEGKVISWIAEWLSGRFQRVVCNGSESKWVPVTSGVPQGSVLGPALFLIYVNDMDDGIISKLLKFADDTKVFNSVTSQVEVNELRQDLKRLCDWSDKWQMEFNIDKCKVMHLGHNNKKVEYQMHGKSLEIIKEEKDLGVIISDDFKVTKQCAKASKKGNQVLGMISRTFEGRSKRFIIQLYKSLVRPHLDYCVQAWKPCLVKDIDMLEKVQRRATRMVEGCKGWSYERRLNKSRLTTLETRRNRADLLEVYKIFNNLEGLSKDDYFKVNESNTRGHTYKIKKRSFRTNIGKNLFSNRVVNAWNGLSQEAVEAKSLNVFKGKIEEYLSRMGGT
jgi:hypothetical protein